MEIIRTTSEAIGPVFTRWIEARPEVRLVVIEGYPGSGKSELLKALPSAWGRIEIDLLIGRDHDESRAWTELARASGAVEQAREMLARSPVVVVEGPAAWPVFDGLLRELGPAGRRVYLKHLPISGGVPHWTDGDDREFWVTSANHEFWRDIMRHHAGMPEADADLILERVSSPTTPESLYEELKG